MLHSNVHFCSVIQLDSAIIIFLQTLYPCFTMVDRVTSRQTMSPFASYQFCHLIQTSNTESSFCNLQVSFIASNLLQAQSQQPRTSQNTSIISHVQSIRYFRGRVLLYPRILLSFRSGSMSQAGLLFPFWKRLTGLFWGLWCIMGHPRELMHKLTFTCVILVGFMLTFYCFLLLSG